MRSPRYPQAEFTASRDFTPGIRFDRYRGVINHVQQGYTSTMVMWAKMSQVGDKKRNRVSAHFTISRDGTVRQYVELGHTAWHAGWRKGKPIPTWPRFDGVNPNRYAIGIEWEGFSKPPQTYGYDYCYGTGPDRKGKPRTPWPWAAVRAGIALYRWIWAEDWMDAPPSELTVTGHYAIDPVNRLDDPGEAFNSKVAPVLISQAVAARPESDDVAAIRAEIEQLSRLFHSHRHNLSPPGEGGD